MRRYLSTFAFMALSILCAEYKLVDQLTNVIASDNKSTPLPLLTPVGQSGDWDLLFNDDFDSTTLNTNNWTTCYWWNDGGCTNLDNNELEWYQPDDVLVDNGVLKLQAQERTIVASDGNTYHYTSGIVTTGRSSWRKKLPTRFVLQYGYAEIRAKIPTGQGLWPAFWLLPATHRSKPEIDVMEILGHDPHTVHMNFHYQNSNGGNSSDGYFWAGPDFSAGWHTYAIDWQPDVIIWYVDGIERWRYTDTAHIPAEPMYLLANLAVGGDWPGAPDASTPFPSYFEIDYVRVWQRGDWVRLTPTADTFVNSAQPLENFGSDSTLQSDGTPTKITYLKFDSMVLAGAIITAAKLRIKTTLGSSTQSPNAHSIKLVNDTTWSENAITYDGKPIISSVILGDIVNLSPDTMYDIPLDVTLLQSKIGNTFSLAIDSAAENELSFYSKEHPSDNPQLIITSFFYPVYLPLLVK